MNGATFAPGKVGQAFSFDGVDDYVRVPDSAAWPAGSANFSINLWVNFNAVRAGGHRSVPNIFLVQNEAHGFFDKWFFYLADEGLYLHLSGPVSGEVFIGPVAFTPVPGAWYHLAVTRSGNIYSFYVNGQSLWSVVNGQTIIPILFITEDLVKSSRTREVFGSIRSPGWPPPRRNSDVVILNSGNTIRCIG